MRLNPTKCHYMCIGKKQRKFNFDFIFNENRSLENSKREVILGSNIDNNLFFDNHVKKICRKASQNICTL